MANHGITCLLQNNADCKYSIFSSSRLSTIVIDQEISDKNVRVYFKIFFLKSNRLFINEKLLGTTLDLSAQILDFMYGSNECIVPCRI